MDKKKFKKSIKSSYRKLKYLDKTQSSYFIVTSFLAFFCMFTGITYSYFTFSKTLNAATIAIAKLNYTLTSETDGYSNGTVTVPAGETIFVDLDLKSQNNGKTRYALNYSSTSQDVHVYYSETYKNNMTGVIGAVGSVIDMRVVLVNSGTTDATVTFEVTGGYLQNTLTTNIVNGYFEQDVTIRTVLYDENFENPTPAPSFPDKAEYSYYKTECTGGYTGVFNETNWTLTIPEGTQTSCDVYFKKASNELEIYYLITGTNKTSEVSTVKPDTTGLYTYTSSSCSNGATYTFNESTFEFSVTSSTANTLCVANFTTNEKLESASKYTVLFNANGGEVRTQSKTVIAGGTYGSLPLPTKEGYYFAGWYTALEGGTLVDKTTIVTETKHHTLYATWTPASIDTTIAALNITANEGTPDFSQIATTDEGVYTMEDNYGTSYYYRGSVENNYVKFAGFYWRIIRVNGDGSVRIIYDGTSAYANGVSNTDRSALHSVSWNETNYNDAKYVGYMYGGANGEASESNEEAQYNETSTNAKIHLEAWYKTNIEDKGYNKSLADVIFCHDRTTPGSSASGWTLDTGLGYGLNVTAYGARTRFIAGNSVKTNISPIFTCLENDIVTLNNDWFTAEATSSNKGNGALEYPIGMISADEISAAGGRIYFSASDNNLSYYLYKGHWYWSFSPSVLFNDNHARVFRVSSEGSIYGYNDVTSLGAIAPVINLSKEYAGSLKGTGTMTDPFTND